jgi:hypothetical protein
MKKIVIVTGVCALLVVIAYFWFSHSSASQDPRGDRYAGSVACERCHGSIYGSYLHTAHFLASLPATNQNVHGRFDQGFNTFKINDSQKVVMEKLYNGLFQTYYLNGKLKTRYRFDIVFGGVKGESYLSWRGNELDQLPLSYFTQGRQWSTSPGYGFNFLDYPRLRLVSKGCLECHTSYIENVAGELPRLDKAEEFDKSTLVYHIDCERCHGPGAEHVNFQTDNPGIKTAHFITAYRSLDRSQKIDMCAVCHSGPPQIMIRSKFEFVPGDTFAKFKIPDLSKNFDTAHLDVHGNQVQMLQSSRCYVNSNMECATCHDTHVNTRGNEMIYAQKCLSCHNSPKHSFCKMTAQLGMVALEKNCIGCHMPALSTKIISVRISNSTPPIPFFVHTHHIAVYPQEVKKILAYINQ